MSESRVRKKALKEAGIQDAAKFNEILDIQARAINTGLRTEDQGKKIDEKLFGSLAKGALDPIFEKVGIMSTEIDQWLSQHPEAVAVLAKGTKEQIKRTLDEMTNELTQGQFATIASFDDGWQIDHTDVSRVAAKTVAIYVTLVEARIELEQSNKKSGTYGKASLPAGQGKTIELGIRKLKQAIRVTQESIGLFEYLAEAYKNNKTPTPQNIFKNYKAYIKRKGGDWNLTGYKQKVVDAVNGRGEQTYTVMASATNQAEKGAFEAAVPREIGKLVGNMRAIPNNVIATEMLSRLHKSKAMQNTDIIGSKPLTSEIANQIGDIALGKKTRPYKPSPKKSTKPYKNKTPKHEKAIREMERQQRVAIKNIAKLRTLTKSTTKAVNNPGSKSNDKEEARRIAKARLAIQAKLPAEIRRNMGRPALINRTGRFSNSVKLETLSASKAGMVGVYSYMLKPYETFENTGKQKWPIAYNPKTLITKSIRNLAMGYAAGKLTLRRI